jgi:hypothetical protein
VNTRPIDKQYDVIWSAGPRGMTDPQFTKAFGITPTHVKSLRRQLQLAGRLRRTTDDAGRSSFQGRLLDVGIAVED